MNRFFFSESRKLAMALDKSDLSGLQVGDILLTTYDAQDERENTPDKPGPGTYRNGKELPFYRKILGDPSRHLQGGYTHSAVYVGGGDVIEAEGGKINQVMRRPLAESLAGRDGAVAVRVKAPKKDRLAAAKYVSSQIGKPYPSNMTILRQGLGLMSKAVAPLVDTKKSPEEVGNFTCANVITAGYERQGHDLLDDGRSWFMGVPSDFTNSKKVDLVKTIGAKDRLAPMFGRLAKIDRVTAKLAESKVNWGNALGTAGAVGGAAWGLSRRGRFDASWMNPAWKGQFGIKQRLAQGLMGAGTGAALYLPATIASQPLVNRAQPTMNRVQQRALPGWGQNGA
jgi:hypothetical protein